jgi:hypothetical protein
MCRCGHEQLWHQAGRNACQHTRLLPFQLGPAESDLDKALIGERHERIVGDGKSREGYDFGKGYEPLWCVLLPMERDCPCETFVPVLSQPTEGASDGRREETPEVVSLRGGSHGSR